MGTHETPFGVARSVLRLDGEEPYLCLEFVILYVRDLDRSLRFYVDQLGFRVVVDHRFMITGEYGTDPTLRFKNTSININVVTMISKRVEAGEPVDVFSLFQQMREALSGAQKRFSVNRNE